MRCRNMRNHRTDLGDERTTHWYDLILPVSTINDYHDPEG
jgi:hypothetical protein